MASLIFGLKHFMQYLLGRHFVCRLDHMSIVYYNRTRDPVGQQSRYLDFVSQFDIEFVRRPGVQHINADSLSRRRPCERDEGEPCRQCNRRVIDVHEDNVQVRALQSRRRKIPQHDYKADAGFRPSKRNLHEERAVQLADECLTASMPQAIGGQETQVTAETCNEQTEKNVNTETGLPIRKTSRSKHKLTGIIGHTAPGAFHANVADWSLDFLATQPQLDSDIAPVLQWLCVDKNRPDWLEVKSKSPALRSLWQQFDSLVVQHNVLYRSFYRADGTIYYFHVVLPANLKPSFL
jgi:hypothetical protein